MKYLDLDGLTHFLDKVVSLINDLLPDDYVSFKSQSLTDAQKSQARSNITSDSGWVSINSYVVYRKINDVIYLRVRQSAGTSRSSGYVFATLPEAIAPVYSLAEANVYGLGRVFINQNHTITWESSSTSDKTNYIQASFVYPLG